MAPLSKKPKLQEQVVIVPLLPPDTHSVQLLAIPEHCEHGCFYIYKILTKLKYLDYVFIKYQIFKIIFFTWSNFILFIYLNFV